MGPRFFPLRTFSRPLAMVALGAALSGCFLVTDVDRFEATAPNTSRFYDLDFTIRGADSHVGEMFELRVLDETKAILAVFRAEPLGASQASFKLPASLPKDQKLRLIFWADHNFTGVYDRTPEPFDHSWFVDVDPFKPTDPADNVVKIVYDHNSQFVPVEGNDLGNPVQIAFSGLNALMGKRVQVRVSDANSKQLVASYRVTKVTKDTLSATLPKVIDPGAGTRYLVDVVVDDGQGGGLEGYRFEQSTTATGLSLSFDPTRDQDKKTTADLKPL